MKEKGCYHCANEITTFNRIEFDSKEFCCNGCKTVYEIFSSNDLQDYYVLQAQAGAKISQVDGKYDFLQNKDIVDKLLDFQEADTAIVSLYIPHIHCSSCIWILENLHKLNQAVFRVVVNFPKKQATITYNSQRIDLKELVSLLHSIGYEPYISLDNFEKKPPSIDRSLLYRIGIAFFAFGNVMMLSFPEYFNIEDVWMREYKDFFRWLILIISLPVFFYCAYPYHKAALSGIRTGNYTIDIPMSLGIVVMFIRSTIDIVFDLGPGFFDSMTMLVFFMLLGKLFQQRSYNFLSFERDYKSYFPIAITKINQDKQEEPIQVYQIQKGDRLIIRNQELIPVDAILLSQRAFIDYSFVTGEAMAVEKLSGEKLYAGGKQKGELIEIQAINTVSQSYLTQLWSNDVFQKKVQLKYRTITDQISRFFTPVLLLISLFTLIGWSFVSWSIAFNTVTAILIVACPCALALSAPFTLGNAIRIFGRNKFYLKNATVVEQLNKVDTVVFDKTGTITTGINSVIYYQGEALTPIEKAHIKSIIRGSNHPLSRKLYNFLEATTLEKPSSFEEIPGKGLKGVISGRSYSIGSRKLLQQPIEDLHAQTTVHIEIDKQYKGCFIFDNHYREGLVELFESLDKKGYKLVVLSGDNDGEHQVLTSMLPESVTLVFNQKPQEKLDYIKELKQQGHNVMMVGDGLNDAGALAMSDVGVSVSEDVNVFTPASDAILDSTKFSNLSKYLIFSKISVKIIKLSYILALSYNVIGITVSICNKMSPLVAAILMPISTVSIISCVSILTNFYAKKIIRSKS